MCAYNTKQENRDYLTIDNDIKENSFKQVYLLYGPESYLLRQYRDKLFAALDINNPDNAMNISEFKGSGIDENEIISIADTIPFFAEARTIVITDSGFFKSSPDKLADYIKKDIPESTRIIFIENEKGDPEQSDKAEAKEVDKRSKMFKAVKEKGSAVLFSTQSETVLKSWIANRLLKSCDRKISGQTLDYFLSKTGFSMCNIKNETDKLISYTEGKTEITAEDIDDIVTPRTQDKVFDMINAMVRGKQKEALSLYYDMLSLRVPTQKILFNVINQFNSMLMAKELRQKGCNSATIAEKMRLGAANSWRVDKMLSNANEYSVEQLKDAVICGVQTDERIKKGLISDRLGLEMLIIKYSRH